MPVTVGYGVGPEETVFPFTQAQAELRGVFADLYLWHKAEAALPLRVSRFDGGDEISSSSSSAGSSPRLVIVDADGATIFDSDAAGVAYAGRDFSDLYYLHCWEGANVICRLLQRQDVVVSALVEPVYGVLDVRVSERAPDQVTTLTVNDETLTGHIRLEAGYNTELVLGDAALPGFREPTGSRNAQNIRVDLSPGLGEGRFDGCGGAPVRLLRRLGGVGPDSSGNVQIEAEGCYWIRPPSDGAGSASLDNLGVLAGTLQIGNDCGVCCECDDYVNVYRALKKLNARFLNLGARAEQNRDRFAEIKAKWLDSRNCRKRQPVQMILASPAPGYFVVSLQVCNLHDTDCLEASLQIGVDPPTALPVDFGVLRSNPLTEQWENTVLAGQPGSFTTGWATLDPGHAGRLRMTLAGAAAVQVTVTATVGGETFDPVVKSINSLPYMSGGALVVA